MIYGLKLLQRGRNNTNDDINNNNNNTNLNNMDNNVNFNDDDYRYFLSLNFFELRI